MGLWGLSRLTLRPRVDEKAEVRVLDLARLKYFCTVSSYICGVSVVVNLKRRPESGTTRKVRQVTNVASRLPILRVFVSLIHVICQWSGWELELNPAARGQ